MRPKGFFITGTGTGVGKTVVTACLLAVLKKRGINAGVMKPVETGVDSDGHSDAEFLLNVGQTGDCLDEVCPYRFKAAASPWQAALLEEADPVDEKVIQDMFCQLAAKHDFILAEGVGGLLVPLRENYMVADLIRAMSLPAIVVSPLQLGAVNHTLLTLESAKKYGIDVKGIIFNRLGNSEKTDAEKGQREIIERLSGTKILGECPYIDHLSPASFTPELIKEIETQIDFPEIMEEPCQ